LYNNKGLEFEPLFHSLSPFSIKIFHVLFGHSYEEKC